MTTTFARLTGLFLIALLARAYAVEMVPIPNNNGAPAEVAPGDQDSEGLDQPPSPVVPSQVPPPGSPAVNQMPAQPAQSPRAASPFASEAARRSAARPPAGPAPGGAAPPVAAAGGEIAMRSGELLFNFQDTDIQAVVKYVSKSTGRTFLLDPRVKGKVTIISYKPIPKSAAFDVFVSALKAQGFSAVEGPGGIVKIVPEAEAKLNSRVSSATTARNSDQWVTHVIVVQHASAPQLVPLLRPLMSPMALLSVYPPGNILVVTDTAASVRNVLGVISRIDQQGSTDVTIIPLENASVVDVAQLVGRFAEGAQVGGQPGQPPIPGGAGADSRLVVIPDLRTNSLLVRADNPGRVEELRSLVAKLDVPARGGGQTHVVYLRNADAAKLSEILRGLLAGEARGAAGAAVPGAPAVGGSKGADNSLIQPDVASNALVISASDSVYNNLRSVIEKLDQRRAQVYVEALIVEIGTDRALQYGIQWVAGTGAGDGAVAGVQNFSGAPGIISTVLQKGANLAGADGLTLGFIGREITLPDGTTVRGLGALARALQNDTEANVLSTPNLVTLDNAEAKIVVGQNVPFVTGSYAQSTGTGTGGNTVNPFQTIERKDVGLTLKVKPQISEGGGVKLVINQEVSSIAKSAQQATDLITNKRSIDTTVIIDDGDTMVLGGLIEERSADVVSKIPLLGSIPIIGELFRYTDKSRQKVNLMVFLRPIIIHNAQDTYTVSADRYETIGAEVRDDKGKRGAIARRFKPVPPKPKAKEPEREAGAGEAVAAPDSAAAPSPSAVPSPSPAPVPPAAAAPSADAGTSATP